MEWPASGNGRFWPKADCAVVTLGRREEDKE
jgi:hypothetical protein